MLKRTLSQTASSIMVLAFLAGLLLAGPVALRVSGKAQATTITFTCCSYTPATVTIHTGEDVMWQGDFTSHPLVSDDGLWTTVNSGTEFSHTFTQPGEYLFHCAIHGGPGGVGMSGKVIVFDSQTVFLPLIKR